MSYQRGETVGVYVFPRETAELQTRHEFVFDEFIRDSVTNMSEAVSALLDGMEILGIERDSRVECWDAFLHETTTGEPGTFHAFNDNRESFGWVSIGDTMSKAVAIIGDTAMICTVVPPIQPRPE